MLTSSKSPVFHPLSTVLYVLLLQVSLTPSLSQTFEPSQVDDDQNSNAFLFDPGFDIRKVASLAVALPSHSWEFGTASEALLELYTPELAVFGKDPFSFLRSQGQSQQISTNVDQVPSLVYARSKISLNLTETAGANVLSDGDGATGDPASLGVSAVLLGGSNEKFKEGAKKTVDYLMNGAPRFENGAISQRADIAELWADFIYMAPPFLAYYAVTTSNVSLLLETVRQCGLYREVLQLGSDTSTDSENANPTLPTIDGLWRHIIGTQIPDPGLWSTGNAWSAAGMTRVLATVIKAPRSLFTSPSSSSNARIIAINILTTYIKEVLDGVVNAPLENGLLRNYLNETLESGHGYGEISGSTLLASVVYRMVILRPDVFLFGHPVSGFSSDSTFNTTAFDSGATSRINRYLNWADGIRHTIGSGGHVSINGTVSPAVDPLNWASTTPYTAGSPEGQNFVVLMYAAWRDCVVVGICQGFQLGGLFEKL